MEGWGENNNIPFHPDHERSYTVCTIHICLYVLAQIHVINLTSMAPASPLKLAGEIKWSKDMVVLHISKLARIPGTELRRTQNPRSKKSKIFPSSGLSFRQMSRGG